MLATILKGSSPRSEKLVRELAETADIEVFATTHDLIEACRFARLSDVFIIDYTIQGNILAIIQAISSVIGTTTIVVVNVPDDPIEIVACLESGAFAYVRETETGTMMCDVIHDAGCGRARLDGKVAPALIARLSLLRALQPPETGEHGKG
jgi:DNA-binding NarL/FixJ family response regulator